MIDAPPVFSERLYADCRRFISEYLKGRTFGREKEDFDNETVSVAADSPETYSFCASELSDYIAGKLSTIYAEKVMLLRIRGGLAKLFISDISFIRRENDLAVYHMRDKRTLAGTTLRTSFEFAVKELLLNHGFILCGVSLALNPQRIFAFHENRVIFDNEDELFISDRLYYPAKKRFEAYFGALNNIR